MLLGIFTALFHDCELEEALRRVKKIGFEAVELYTGNLNPPIHCDPEVLLNDCGALDRFKALIDKYGLKISQLNCSGNPVSPIPGEAQRHIRGFENTIKLCEKLGIDTITSFSGCPGGGPKDETPNWITCPWPDEFLPMLEYQWNEVLIPYWQDAVKKAADYGVNKIGMEMHPGFNVYNPETLLKLRSAVGNEIGANFDPSHLVWQGIDIPQAILTLDQAIFHVHAKDTRVQVRNIRKNGNLDTKHYSDERNRAWIFGTCGYGNGEIYWKGIIDALVIIGYDYVISVEHEDSLLSRDEGLQKAYDFLRPMIPKEKSGEMWWA